MNNGLMTRVEYCTSIGDTQNIIQLNEWHHIDLALYPPR